MRVAPSPARRPRPQQAVAMTKERGGDPPAGGAPTPDPPSPVVERRKKPMVHPAAPAPLPKDYAFTFFDPNDVACREILLDPHTTVPQLFAILRQWVPQVQHSIDVIGNEILRRGCHVNDRDGLTDMTLLHYACKAGAHGVGDPAAAVRLSTRLLALGGDVTLRSRWTHMNALHYAAYFDVPELIRTLLRAAAPRVLHSTCSDFSHGTALHIAASNLCLGAVRCLLEHGADPALRNSKGQVAAEVVPDPMDMALDKAEAALAARELRQLLLDAVPLSCSLPRVTLPNYDNLPGNLMLLCLGLQLGDRVRVDGGKVGTLRFCGTTAFASGQWAGVELDEPEGKNDGSVGGVRYFICPPKQGVFASVSKISKAEEQPLEPPPPHSPLGPPARAPHRARKDKRAPRKRGGAWLDREGHRVAPGDAVLVAGQRPGRARFYGRTDFAPGYWFGVELDSARGKHDGSVFGVRYFSCPPKHGVFAPPSRVQRVGGPREELGDSALEKKVQQVTVSQPKRNFPAVRTPKDITSESSFSRLLFCCWFPWMLRAEMQS
ncbi:LOW QUALITY PROTEIN: CAP-Gly domain-containing linker protein 3-like [Aquila chrysaetos chrysaetos]|uniref:LOW QUALITY PROTEIN: CAP-Gly domain-containing linker protein 3-like n=1 Tax=Aquila chrysaetos chrysaetos TaxID=223781 RepID=UPI001B7D4056|nr:LOW QUALITY PROTEIN: CAP-Gly domain-containing linker protein 3-like [Aquila chrysaetos chrysaetos]